MPVQIELRRDAEAPASARRWMAPLRQAVGPAVFENARLLVSELVTNAVRHAGPDTSGSVRLNVQTTPARVRVEVIDLGPGFQPPAAVRPAAHEGSSGWGLYMVDRLADRWGVRVDGGTLVWFELDQPRG